MYKAKKKYGQNFLIDTNIINKIIDSVSINSNDKIIEIGPGKGYLTQELKTFNNELYCFEIDNDMNKFLSKLEDDKTRIIYNDFLNVNLNEYFNRDDNIRVIANIPYYITTPIIEHLIESKLNILDMTLMVQKEVADRLCSKPGNSDYGYYWIDGGVQSGSRIYSRFVFNNGNVKTQPSRLWIQEVDDIEKTTSAEMPAVHAGNGANNWAYILNIFYAIRPIRD